MPHQAPTIDWRYILQVITGAIALFGMMASWKIFQPKVVLLRQLRAAVKEKSDLSEVADTLQHSLDTVLVANTALQAEIDRNNVRFEEIEAQVEQLRYLYGSSIRYIVKAIRVSARKGVHLPPLPDEISQAVFNWSEEVYPGENGDIAKE